MAQINILIVEDDKKLNDGIRLALRDTGDQFYQSMTLKEAEQVLNNYRIDLVLLDVNLPDGNGIEFIKKIRKTSAVPVILITVSNMEIDIVTGLEAGANDYITKPFSLMVLRARAAVQLRDKSAMDCSHLRIDDYDFDFERMEFFKAGVSVELSKTEQRLLRVLCENRGATVKREALIDYVWHGDKEFVEEHALTVTVKRLRDKLGDNSNHPEYIRTVYGIGYTWAIKG